MELKLGCWLFSGGGAETGRNFRELLGAGSILCQSVINHMGAFTFWKVIQLNMYGLCTFGGYVILVYYANKKSILKE